ncbi:MAG: domain S-box protein [Thermodesulfobacteriota bacterium]|nr:domain S-box protein [Thermodesulfobacteriota bacterium]
MRPVRPALTLWFQSRRRFEGIGFFVVDFAFQTVAFLLIVLRGSIPDWISIVVANGLIVAGAILGYMGLERFVDKRSSQVHNFIVMAVFVAIHTYFAFFQPNLAIRNLNVTIAGLIICFRCMWLLLYRVEAGMRPFTWGVGLVFGGHCLLSLLRIGDFFWGGDPGNEFLKPGIFEPLVLICYQLLLILLACGLVLMVNKRLFADIQTEQEKFSKAFHSSSYALTLTRLSDGQIVEVNEGFVNITGYPAAEVLGQTTVGLHIWDRQEDRMAVVKELSEKGKVHGREFTFRKRSGEVLTGLFSADVIYINNEAFVLSSISDITERKMGEMEGERLIHALQEALAKVKRLSGMLPICASCKKIRDDQGYWNQIEVYIRDHSEAEFSHGICPECMQKTVSGIRYRRWRIQNRGLKGEEGRVKKGVYRYGSQKWIENQQMRR